MFIINQLPTQEEYDMQKLILTKEEFAEYCLAITVFVWNNRESVAVVNEEGKY